MCCSATSCHNSRRSLPPRRPRTFTQRSYHIQDPTEHGTQSVSAVDDPHRPFADLGNGAGGALARAATTPDAQSYPNWERLTTARSSEEMKHATNTPTAAAHILLHLIRSFYAPRCRL